LNVDFAIRYWIANGAPAYKINIGLATYGRSFTLASNKTGIGAPSMGSGPAGIYTREPGFLAYYEICKKLEEGFTRVWDNQQMVPYTFNGSEWISYEDTESLTHKVSFLSYFRSILIIREANINDTLRLTTLFEWV
jgi:GH18 family chitinase